MTKFGQVLGVVFRGHVEIVGKIIWHHFCNMNACFLKMAVIGRVKGKIFMINKKTDKLSSQINKGFEWIDWRLERIERKIFSIEDNLVKNKKIEDRRKKNYLK